MSLKAADNIPTAIPPHILGVFAYLDQALPAVMRDRFATEDIGIGPVALNDRPHDLRELGRTLLQRSFPLKDDNAPLCQELETFRLYHSSDKADALITAYGQRAMGRNPLPALIADYAIRSGGILRWADEDELRAEAEKDPGHAYRKIHRYIRNGDRIAHYSLPTQSGLMLVRGDRLVCSVSTLHMSIEGVSDADWERRRTKWEGGGARGLRLCRTMAWVGSDRS